MNLQPVPGSGRYWRDLLEAVVIETPCNDLSERIQAAQDAVMDEIEIIYPTATESERLQLVNALNALREFRRVCETPTPGKRLKLMSPRADAQA
jgi:hypothetical protein